MNSPKIFHNKLFIWLVPLLMIPFWFLFGMFFIWLWNGSWPIRPGVSTTWDWVGWVLQKYFAFFVALPIFLLQMLPCLILFVLSCGRWLRRPSLLSFVTILFTSFGVMGAYMLAVAMYLGPWPGISNSLGIGYAWSAFTLLLLAVLFFVCLYWRNNQPGVISLIALLSSGLLLLISFAGLFLIPRVFMIP